LTRSVPAPTPHNSDQIAHEILEDLVAKLARTVDEHDATTRNEPAEAAAPIQTAVQRLGRLLLLRQTVNRAIDVQLRLEQVRIRRDTIERQAARSRTPEFSPPTYSDHA
jgi:hypothetical protein